MTAVALLVDKGSGPQDLASVNRVMTMADDLLSPPAKRGANVVIPYSDGETRTDKQTDARTISVGYQLAGGDSEGNPVQGQEFVYLMNVYLEMLGLLPDPTDGTDMSCVLTRQLALPSGTVADTADAEYLNTKFQRHPDSARHALVVVEFRLLSGVFA